MPPDIANMVSVVPVLVGFFSSSVTFVVDDVCAAIVTGSVAGRMVWVKSGLAGFFSGCAVSLCVDDLFDRAGMTWSVACRNEGVTK